MKACQDVSLAGQRRGLKPGTRSGLWANFAYAIDQLRPRMVVIENVRGLLSAEAHSDVEQCAWCVGGAADGEPALRALGAVLGDLAELGYDAAWHGLRAADVGAPHGRFRVFIVARPTPDADDERYQGGDGPAGRWGNGSADYDHTDRDTDSSWTRAIEPIQEWAPSHPGGAGATAEDANGAARREWRVAAPGQAAGRWARTDAGGRGGASAADTDGHPVRHQPVSEPRSGRQAVPGHTGTDAPADASGDGWDKGRPESARFVGGPDASFGGDEPCSACGCAEWLHDADGFCAGPCRGRCAQAPADAHRDGRESLRVVQSIERDPHGRSGPDVAWGDYEPAIRRWEAVLGRPAPAPTEPGAKGQPRLSPRFVEWMIGIPDGWVTGVPGLTRNDQLKILGNGVVPQQAEAAVRRLLAALERAA